MDKVYVLQHFDRFGDIDDSRERWSFFELYESEEDAYKVMRKSLAELKKSKTYFDEDEFPVRGWFLETRCNGYKLHNPTADMEYSMSIYPQEVKRKG